MKRAREIIEKYGDSGKIGIAVSGGVDSMTLLFLAMETLKKEKIVVLNMEHGIRGESSKADSEFVRAFSEKNGLEFISKSVSVPRLCEKSGRSEETEARLARHEFFRDMLAIGRVNKIMLAHNEGDKTESVIMHLLRGAGVKGLKGMSELDGDYIRPLLSVSRAKIEEYALANRVPFVTDESNYDTAYTRNFLRKEILPKLRQRYEVDGAIETLSNNARRDDDFIESQLSYNEYIEVEGDTVFLLLGALDLHPALSSRLIFRAIEFLGRKCDITAKHIDSVLSLKKAENGKTVDLGQGLRVAREYNRLALYLEIEQGEASEVVPFSLGFTPFLNGMVEATNAEAKPQKGKLIVDLDKIPDEAVIRVRKDGDTFRPYGGGKKKLKEYLIDKKIPLRKRDKLPLLCYNENILAIFGVEIGDELKLTENTVNALELKFTED